MSKASELITSIVSTNADPARETMTVKVENAAGEQTDLVFHPAVLAPLIMGIMGSSSVFVPKGTEGMVTQALNLTSIRGFVKDERTVGLDLILEKKLRVPIIFPRSSASKLAVQIQELEKMPFQASPKGKH